MTGWPDAHSHTDLTPKNRWPIDGNHETLEDNGLAVSRWNFLYPLVPWDA